MKKLLLGCIGILFIVSGSIASSVYPISPVKTFSGKTQASAVFNSFRAHRMERYGTELSWSVLVPGDITTFSVEQSYDGDFYVPIGEVASDGKATYRYKDGHVFPGYIYYRVAAYMNDGSVVYSDVAVVRVVQRK